MPQPDWDPSIFGCCPAKTLIQRRHRKRFQKTSPANRWFPTIHCNHGDQTPRPRRGTSPRRRNALLQGRQASPSSSRRPSTTHPAGHHTRSLAGDAERWRLAHQEHRGLSSRATHAGARRARQPLRQLHQPELPERLHHHAHQHPPRPAARDRQRTQTRAKQSLPRRRGHLPPAPLVRRLYRDLHPPRLRLPLRARMERRVRLPGRHNTQALQAPRRLRHGQHPDPAGSHRRDRRRHRRREGGRRHHRRRHERRAGLRGQSAREVQAAQGCSRDGV